MPDHLHLLIGKRPTECESDLMRDLKRDSSEWINKRRLCPQPFSWQEGYGAFSYSKRDIPVVAAYIRNQGEHHRKKSFRQEIIGLLSEFDMPYKPEYLYHEPL